MPRSFFHIVVLLFLFIAIFPCSIVLAETVSVGSDTVPVGSAVEIPILLNTAPRGLFEFSLTVSLANGDIADVERVVLPAAFNKTASINISSDYNSVTISARDADDLVKPGASKIGLAQVILRGTFKGDSEIQLGVTKLVDDSGTSPVSTTSTGELDVTGGPAAGVATVVAGSDGVMVNETFGTPIILSEASNGLSSYRLTVKLARRETAQIEGVRFVAFEGDANVEVAADGSSVSFSANDLEDKVRPGTVGVILARVLFKGVLPGSSPIQIQINRMEDEAGLKAASATMDGMLTVSGLIDLPPSFFNEQPHDRSTVGLNQPTISVEISDDNNDIAPETIRMRVTDSAASWTFDRRNSGVLWDGETFSLDLNAEGVSLADGNVTVEASAEDGGGHLGQFSWTFTVDTGVGPPSEEQTIEEAIASLVTGDPPAAATADLIIGDQEILQAIGFWINGAPVPGTGGQKISDSKMLELVQLWITGAPVG